MMVIHDTTSQKGVLQTNVNNLDILVFKHNFHYCFAHHWNTKYFAKVQKCAGNQNPLLLKPS